VPEQTPTPPPPLVRVSQIAAPQPVVRVPPRYPKLAIDIGLSGVVVVEAEVDTTGRVRTVRALSGHKLLVDAALEAVSHWRYQPMLLNGEPTAFILNVKVEFTARRG
jgi:TonB family protein